MLDALTLAASEAEGRDLLLRILNISSYENLGWVLLGLAGQAAFMLRMLVQWIATERERRSVVPTIFWWLSLGGGAILLIYFLWRKDIVGVLGQTTGVVVYARNLWYIHKGDRTSAPAGAAGAVEEGSVAR